MDRSEPEFKSTRFQLRPYPPVERTHNLVNAGYPRLVCHRDGGGRANVGIAAETATEMPDPCRPVAGALSENR